MPLDSLPFPARAARLLTAALVSACDGTINREATLTDHEVLSIDACQRVVLSGVRPATPDGKPREQVFCAEPSPDAIVARASYLNAINIPVNGQEVGVSAGLGELAGSIGLRTQTIQLLRDGYYRVCEAYLNGAIDDRTYEAIFDHIDTFMITLVALEAVTGVVAVPAVALAATGQEGDQGNGGGTASTISIEDITAQPATLAAHQTEAVAKIVTAYLKRRRP
ncbi:MAG: hypothetical protein AAFU34_18075 [Pseudomonadota bacterium]